MTNHTTTHTTTHTMRQRTSTSPLQRSGLTLIVSALIGLAGTAQAQVAGVTTTTAVVVAESSQVAMGWSAKKSLIGKTVYNEAKDKVGKVEDLIISPDRTVTYVILGAGGFLGMGRHDVAVPISRISDVGGRLLMEGATKDAVKAMAPFTYVDDGARRVDLMARADADISRAKLQVTTLEKKAENASTDAKAKLATQTTALKQDLAATEAKLSEMRQATASRWKEFASELTAATAKLRKSSEAPAAG